MNRTNAFYVVGNYFFIILKRLHGTQYTCLVCGCICLLIVTAYLRSARAIRKYCTCIYVFNDSRGRIVEGYLHHFCSRKYSKDLSCWKNRGVCEAEKEQKRFNAFYSQRKYRYLFLINGNNNILFIVQRSSAWKELY